MSKVGGWVNFGPSQFREGGRCKDSQARFCLVGLIGKYVLNVCKFFEICLR